MNKGAPLVRDIRSGYNERKIQILAALEAEQGLGSLEILARIRAISSRDVSVRSVQMALMRYHKQRLLVRRGRRGDYLYELSEKGKRRLEWLRSLTE